MQKTSLAILAAGLGTRFGEGIKQLTPVGPSGELIIDYSIHDALEAGFDRVVFIIRRDLEEDFKEMIGNRTEKLCEVAYAYQELDAVPEGFQVPSKRTKPWGTGQGVLMCRGIIEEPFLVINSDDYYGKESFCKTHDYLLQHAAEQGSYCMAGFILANTLSDNGGVTRGICKADESGFLTDIRETYNIVECPTGACSEDTGEWIDPDSYVSMNMWGLMPDFLDALYENFPQFLKGLDPQDVKTEYLLPDTIGNMMRRGQARVKILETQDKWFGVTYAADKQKVAEAFAKLVEEGVYPSPLA